MFLLCWLILHVHFNMLDSKLKVYYINSWSYGYITIICILYSNKNLFLNTILSYFEIQTAKWRSKLLILNLSDYVYFFSLKQLLEEFKRWLMNIGLKIVWNDWIYYVWNIENHFSIGYVAVKNTIYNLCKATHKKNLDTKLRKLKDTLRLMGLCFTITFIWSWAKLDNNLEMYGEKKITDWKLAFSKVWTHIYL